MGAFAKTNLFVFTFVFCYTCSFVASQGSTCTTYTWLIQTNMNVPGGTLAPNVTQVPDCQQTCFNATTCVGIDYDGASRCWLIYNQTQPQVDQSALVTHYTLIRNMSSCTAFCPSPNPQIWNQTANGHINGATSTNDATFQACFQTCNANTACKGFDWDSVGAGAMCWLTLTGNTNPIQPAPGVFHFDGLCGINIVTPHYIWNAGGSVAMSPVTGSTTPPPSTTTVMQASVTQGYASSTSVPSPGPSGAMPGPGPAAAPAGAGVRNQGMWMVSGLGLLLALMMK